MKFSKKAQRLFATLLIVALTVTMLPVITLSTYATTTEFAGGSGTENDPYLIETKEHLNNVRNDLDAHYKMIADIEFLESDFDAGGDFYNAGQGFEPIGATYNSPFSGTFDGNGFTIENLYINIEADVTIYAGLFGYIKGTIKNLGVLDGSTITTFSSSSYNAFAGGIVGFNKGGIIINCYNTGSISVTCLGDTYTYAGGIVGRNEAGAITNCHNSGNVSSNYNAGGIVGINYEGTTKNCYNEGNIYSNDESGGIAGYNLGTIINCYNTGSVVSKTTAGGIVGYNSQTITNCYNTGNITTNVSDSSYEVHACAGGIAAYNYVNYRIQTITNCYNTGSVSVMSCSQYAIAGGIVGDNPMSGGEITNCYNIGEVSAATTASYGEPYCGGISGKNSYMTLNCCYYYENNNQGVGKGTDTATICTFENLKTQLTFVGFDFNTAWTIKNDANYPFPVLRTISSIVVTAKPNKLIYIEGDAFDTTGMLVTAYYHNNTSETVTNYIVSGYDSNPGIKTITVTRDDWADSFEVEVIAKTLVSISVTIAPDKLNYLEGDTFDTNGMIVTAYYNNNTSEEITDYTISGYDSSPGTKCITITHNNKTASFEVVVKPKEVISIEVTAKPNKLTYLEGDEFDSTGLVITAYYNDNTSKIVTDYIVSGYDSSVGIKTITITHSGKTSTFVVTVNVKTHLTITSDKYIIDKNHICGIGAGTTVSELLAEIDGGELCKVYRGYDEVSEQGTIATGMTVKLLDGDTVKAEYIISVTGDANGDGKIDQYDYIYIKRCYFETLEFDEAQILAADVNLDEKVDQYDYILVKRHYFGTYVISQ